MANWRTEKDGEQNQKDENKRFTRNVKRKGQAEEEVQRPTWPNVNIRRE